VAVAVTGTAIFIFASGNFWRLSLKIFIWDFSPHGRPGMLFVWSATFPYSRSWSRRKWISCCTGKLGWFRRPGHVTEGLYVPDLHLVVHSRHCLQACGVVVSFTKLRCFSGRAPLLAGTPKTGKTTCDLPRIRAEGFILPNGRNRSVFSRG
jgi:hypothetical protein